MVSTTITASCSALCASIGGPATSPMAQTPLTLVRPDRRLDRAAVDLHPELFEAEILAVALTTPTAEISQSPATSTFVCRP